MTENVAGYNTLLAIGAATAASPDLLPAFAADSYTTIEDLENVKPPSGTRAKSEYKVLNLKAAKKVIGSITYNPCTAVAKRAWGHAPQDSLEDDSLAEDPVWRNYRITMPNAGTEVRYFKGSCTQFEYQQITNDDVHAVDVEIEAQDLEVNR